MNPYTSAINAYKAQLASIAGADYSFSVGRVPYTTGDNTPVVVATTPAHIEPAGPNWAVDKIPDAEFYEVCADPSLFQEGDQFWGGAQTPRVTVFSKIDGQEFLAIKTDKPCHIENTTALEGGAWTGLYFDYMNSTSAGPDEYKDPTAWNNPVRRAVLYNIPGISEGMKFWDDDSGWVWEISKVDTKFNISTLFLENPNRV